jgi:hypothetical protein
MACGILDDAFIAEFVAMQCSKAVCKNALLRLIHQRSGPKMPTKNRDVADHRHINGVAVKKRIIEDVKRYTDMHPDMPRLVSILIGDVPEAAV